MINGEPAPSRSPTRHLSVVATLLGLLLIVVYLVGVWAQWRDTGADDIAWARHQALLTSLEALGFTAAGALFGTTVQSRATRQAERRAQNAEQSAADNARDAEKGRALHRVIEAKISGDGDAVRAATRPTGDPLAELRALAKQFDVDKS